MNAIPSFGDLENTADLEGPTFLEAQAMAAERESVQRHTAQRFSGTYGGNRFGMVRIPAPRKPAARKPNPIADVLAKLDDMAAHNSNFARNVLNFYKDRGFLSKGQIEKVREIIATDNARVEARKAETAHAVDNPVIPTESVDLRFIPEGRYAVPNGDTRLKVLIKKPQAPSKWADWIFVSDAAEYGNRTNYGAQKPGRPYEGKIKDQLRAIVNNPKEAMAAYGKLTGSCGICGKHLEDEDSVRIGIGPICRANNGW